MSKPVNRPPLPTITFAQAGEALDRLIQDADRGGGGSGATAEFLLSWWRAERGPPIVRLGNLNPDVREDMIIIMLYLAKNGPRYPDEWDRRADIMRIMEDTIPYEDE